MVKHSITCIHTNTVTHAYVKAHASYLVHIARVIADVCVCAPISLFLCLSVCGWCLCLCSQRMELTAAEVPLNGKTRFPLEHRYNAKCVALIPPPTHPPAHPYMSMPLLPED
jgi:hypothetical protein